MINSHFLELILRVEDCIVGKREEREREKSCQKLIIYLDFITFHQPPKGEGYPLSHCN